MDYHARFEMGDMCREVLKRLRWPKGIACPRCRHTAISTLRNQRKFECAKCEYQFSITAGTIAHDSPLSLEKWFLAVLLICESKNGVSAHQLKRTLGVSYKTAWYLRHRIRAAMKDSSARLVNGVVDGEETCVGAKRRNVGRGTVDPFTDTLKHLMMTENLSFKKLTTQN